MVSLMHVLVVVDPASRRHVTLPSFISILFRNVRTLHINVLQAQVETWGSFWIEVSHGMRARVLAHAGSKRGTDAKIVCVVSAASSMTRATNLRPTPINVSKGPSAILVSHAHDFLTVLT